MKRTESTITVGKVVCMHSTISVKVVIITEDDQEPTGHIRLWSSEMLSVSLTKEENIELIKLLQEADIELQSELEVANA